MGSLRQLGKRPVPNLVRGAASKVEPRFRWHTNFQPLPLRGNSKEPPREMRNKPRGKRRPKHEKLALVWAQPGASSCLGNSEWLSHPKQRLLSTSDRTEVVQHKRPACVGAAKRFVVIVFCPRLWG